MFERQASLCGRPKPDRQAIRIARVICIAGLVLIHIAPYSNARSFAPAGVGAELAYAYVIQVLSRASVPLLSVISGYLLASSLSSAAAWRSAAARRVRSLIVPLVLWNLISLVWSWAARGEPLPKGGVAWLDSLIGLTQFPALDPLHFLRDLYLCVLAAPLLALALRRFGWWVPVALMALCVADLQRPIILSDSILPFFAAGLGLGLGVLKGRAPSAWMVVLAGVLAPALTAALEVAATRGALPVLDGALQIMRFAQRIAGAALFWLAARSLAQGALGRSLAKAEPAAFLVFCSHPFVIAACWALYKRLGQQLVSPSYVAFAASMPLVCFAVALAVAAVGRRIAPGPLAVLTGGKASAASAA